MAMKEDYEFEWDSEKAKTNSHKHGISSQKLKLSGMIHKLLKSTLSPIPKTDGPLSDEPRKTVI